MTDFLAAPSQESPAFRDPVRFVWAKPGTSPCAAGAPSKGAVMTEIITGLEDEDIKTEWRRERASDVGADDDATDPGGADPADATDGDGTDGPGGGDADGADGDADGTDA